MNGLNISNANLAGLMEDVNAGVTCDMISHGTLLVSRICRDLRVNWRAGPRGDLAVLPCSRTLGAGRKELFILCLVELDNELFNHFSHVGDVTLRHDLLIGREEVPSGVAFSCLVRKN